MTNLSDFFPNYHPAMMELDGSTSLYEITTLTTAGNLVTCVARFIAANETGGSSQYIYRLNGPTTDIRSSALIADNDHADTEARGKCRVRLTNNAGTVICDLISLASVVDGLPHTVFFAFDGDNGLATFYLDGVAADDTGWTNRVAPTTGILDTGASSDAMVGTSGAGASLLNGEVGFFGHREAYLTNPLDFMDAKGNPLPLDESGWTEWGAQPLFWNEHGNMDNNLGSGGNMTVNGTIIVGKGGN